MGHRKLYCTWSLPVNMNPKKYLPEIRKKVNVYHFATKMHRNMCVSTIVINSRNHLTTRRTNIQASVHWRLYEKTN